MNRYQRTIDSTVYQAVVEDLAARKLVKVLLLPDRIEFIGGQGSGEN